VNSGRLVMRALRSLRALVSLNFQPGVRRSCVVTSAFLAALGASTATQDAVANGETRALTMIHAHTNETLSIVFKQNGSFDSDALKKLNWFLRDWRIDEPISMAPQLFDVIWYVYREVGATEPIRIMSAYRSPGTNAMLRRRSRAVAKESQHMRGNAMDIHIPGVSMAKVRELGMRLQRGGVGYYPSAGSPFVHLDVGSVRSWPRMPRNQLERLFPDGKTVHIPADGVPLANYQAALAEVQSRGGSALDYDTVTTNRGKSLWALLFGGDEDEDSGEATGRGRTTRVARGRNAAPAPQVAAISTGDSVNAWTGGRPVAPAAPAQTEVRPVETPVIAAPVAVASAPIPVAPAPRPVSEPKSDLEIASLPVPPIRPRGARFEALVASVEPLPPIRPDSFGTQLAGLVPAPATAAAPDAVATPAPAPAAISGLPLPPVRPAAPAVAVAVADPQIAASPSIVSPPALRAVDFPAPPARPAASPSVASAEPALPGIVARPAADPGIAQAYAAIAAPLPPSRPGSAVRAIVPPAPSAVELPHPAVAAARPVPAVRRTNPVALVGARPTAMTRPAHVTAVAEPPVAREVKRSVFATSFSQGPAKGGAGSGGFGGSFIRPTGSSFVSSGE
jgi:uncharacterized protein YcbK (DUF882 family)